MRCARVCQAGGGKLTWRQPPLLTHHTCAWWTPLQREQRLLGRLRHQRWLAEALDELIFTCPRPRDAGHLHVSESADEIWNVGQLDGGRVICLGEIGRNVADQLHVAPDQLPCRATRSRVAEGIEPRAPETPGARQQLERVEHPGPVFALLQPAACRILGREDRRREMEAQLEVALELPSELVEKSATRVE